MRCVTSSEIVFSAQKFVGIMEEAEVGKWVLSHGLLGDL